MDLTSCEYAILDAARRGAFARPTVAALRLRVSDGGGPKGPACAQRRPDQRSGVGQDAQGGKAGADDDNRTRRQKPLKIRGLPGS
jgi:hypothetical protein